MFKRGSALGRSCGKQLHATAMTAKCHTKTGSAAQAARPIQNDNITPTDYYMENSTLGMLTPFSIFKYVEIGTGEHLMNIKLVLFLFMFII